MELIYIYIENTMNYIYKKWIAGFFWRTCHNSETITLMQNSESCSGFCLVEKVILERQISSFLLYESKKLLTFRPVTYTLNTSPRKMLGGVCVRKEGWFGEKNIAVVGSKRWISSVFAQKNPDKWKLEGISRKSYRHLQKLNETRYKISSGLSTVSPNQAVNLWTEGLT